MARPKSARRKRGQTEATDRNMAESLVRKLQRHMHTEQWRQVDLFWRMDDGTGEVTAPQMHAALRQLQMAPSRSEVGALVRRFDTDGNGRVSIAEFLRHLRHAKRDYGDADGAVSTDSGASSSGGGGGGVKARCEELEGQVQSLTDENFMLQLQLSKLQRTLRNTQSSLAAAQANGSVPVPVPEPEDNATSTQAFSLREGWGRVSDAGGDHRRAETAEKLGEQLREELAAERQRSQRADASAAELRRRLASVEAALARVGSSAQRHLAQQEEQREQRDQAVAELQSERQSWQAERAGLQAELAGRGAVEQTLSAEVQQLRRQKDDVQMKLGQALMSGEQLKERLEIRAATRKAKAGAAQRKAKAEAKLQSELQRLQRQKEESETKLAAAKMQLKQAEAKLAESQSSAGQLAAQIAGCGAAPSIANSQRHSEWAE